MPNLQTAETTRAEIKRLETDSYMNQPSSPISSPNRSAGAGEEGSTKMPKSGKKSPDGGY